MYMYLGDFEQLVTFFVILFSISQIFINLFAKTERVFCKNTGIQYEMCGVMMIKM